jgi:hypothetical protein
MKCPAGLALIILLAGFSPAHRGAIEDPLEASGCKTALKEHYGKQATFRLVSRRNSRQGLVFKVSVSNASSTSYKWEARFCTCLVSHSGDEVTIEETGSGHH